MLNYLLAYSISMSLYLLWWYHGKVVVPGREDGAYRGAMRWFGSLLVRGWIIVFVAFFGYMDQGIFGPGYAGWWEGYFAYHSALLWTITTPVVTIALYLPWAATFMAHKNRGTMGRWGDEHGPALHRADMRLPAAWGLVFYGWWILSPTLPFYKCFFKGWLIPGICSLICH